jgi:Streptomyces sporulation and cell division protein, SsgA
VSVVLKERIVMQMTADTNAIFTADLEWESDDPQTLRTTFHAANGNTDWVFARELVQRAFTCGRAGEGDVRIEVDISSGYLVLTLQSPDGTAEARTKSVTVGNFIARTYEVVPEAAENYDAQIDKALEQFLGGP